MHSHHVDLPVWTQNHVVVHAPPCLLCALRPTETNHSESVIRPAQSGIDVYSEPSSLDSGESGQLTPQHTPVRFPKELLSSVCPYRFTPISPTLSPLSQQSIYHRTPARTSIEVLQRGSSSFPRTLHLIQAPRLSLVYLPPAPLAQTAAAAGSTDTPILLPTRHHFALHHLSSEAITLAAIHSKSTT